MEDGEIQEIVGGAVYHPSLEFPGNEVYDGGPSQWMHLYHGVDPSYATSACDYSYSDKLISPSYFPAQGGTSTSTVPSVSKSIPTLRLLVLHSGVLPRAQNLAVFDGYEAIELGRDAPAPGSTATPKVRLKELEVSKLHATVFWDSSRREWAVVDMGSKHGTFVRRPVNIGKSDAAAGNTGPSAVESNGADSRGQRLSLPRVSSVPRSLRHLDELSLGSTTFIVHVHEDSMPCTECSAQGPGNEIPLFHDKTMMRAAKRKLEPDSAVGAAEGGRDPRKALSVLKRSLLSRHSEPPASTTFTAQERKNTTVYVDRSAKRRALHAHTSADAPGIDVLRTTVGTASISVPPIVLPNATPSPPVSAPPTPLPSSNIGHQLLMKQGWVPGATLGTSSDWSAGDAIDGSMALVEPLEVIPRANRAGLGIPASAPSSISTLSGMSWQEQAKLRRWKDYKASDGS